MESVELDDKKTVIKISGTFVAVMLLGYVFSFVFLVGVFTGFYLKRPERVVAYMPDYTMRREVEGTPEPTDETTVVMPGFSKQMERINPSNMSVPSKRRKQR